MITCLRRRRWRGSRLVLLPLLGGLGSLADACQICLPLPTESLADRILASEHLVLARENSEQPYTLRAIRTLKGTPAAAPPVDLFLDSNTRRLLALDPDRSVVCGWSPERREWNRLALHDAALAPVVAAILEQCEDWRDDSAGRVRYFADHLGHEDPVLADLAHIEVARAPYAQLVRFADRLPREALLERLENLRRMEWHALYILFLGRSGHPADHERIRREIADCAEFGLVTRTAAWATAFIEIDGAEAVEQLRAWYVGAASRRSEEREAVLAALTVHGNGDDSALREAITGCMGGLLATDPDLAPSIATALGEWGRDDLAEPIAALLRESPERFDIPATLALRRYLRETAAREAARVDDGPAETVPAALVVSLVLLSLALGLGGKLFRHGSGASRGHAAPPRVP